MNRSQTETLLPFLPLALCWGLFGYLIYHYYPTPWTHFSSLADSLLLGRTNVDGFTHDMVKVGEEYYLPFGPFPAVLLLPFRVFSKGISESEVQFLLLGTLLLLSYRLARRYTGRRGDSVFLVTMFLLASPAFAIGCEAKSWYFSQLVATTALMGALYFWQVQPKPLLIGLCLSATLATRPTAAVFALPLLLLMLRNHESRWACLAKIAAPIAVTVIMLLYYNHARFGNALENGYNLAEVGGYVSPGREYGLFSLHHLPKNLYYYILASFEPQLDQGAMLVFPYIKANPWGLSLFLTSPAFVLALSRWPRDQDEIALSAAGIITFGLLLIYYHTGWMQFGTRYIVDLLPVVWLLICSIHHDRPISQKMRWLIIVSALFNLYSYFATVFNWTA